jgi:hypothetical protein
MAADTLWVLQAVHEPNTDSAQVINTLILNPQQSSLKLHTLEAEHARLRVHRSGLSACSRAHIGGQHKFNDQLPQSNHIDLHSSMQEQHGINTFGCRTAFLPAL